MSDDDVSDDVSDDRVDFKNHNERVLVLIAGRARAGTAIRLTLLVDGLLVSGTTATPKAFMDKALSVLAPDLKNVSSIRPAAGHGCVYLREVRIQSGSLMRDLDPDEILQVSISSVSAMTFSSPAT